ncbi:MAG: AbrB/MazE/SpoVT family DNA-binding domain-containing protein [Deltaproteobacteria bacterium]|nr:AbrB/MazE/SpoVT family DNA-binding domain-containing protein [Deltaproteobacteria bacterium]
MPRVTSKGQVTIPKPVRDRFGIGPGTSVAFEVKRGVVTMRKAQPDDMLDRWLGVLDLPEEVDAFVEALRGGR